MNKLNFILTTLLSGFSLTVFAQTAPVPETQLADTLKLGYQLSVSAQTGSFSIAGVNSSAIEKSPYIDISKALYGKIAGLNVYQGTGASPDNVSTLSIHGHTPLVLIDGYPRSITEITALEIESVQILTDATASTLYGMRGANGIVLITTKRGSNEKLNVHMDYTFGVNTAFRAPDFSDAYTYAHAYNTALVNDGRAPRYNPQELEAFRTGRYPYEFPNVDWWDETVNKAGFTHNLKMSFNGGNDRFRYYTVIDYYHDRSLLKKNTEDDRYKSTPTDTRLSVRANIDVNITPTTYMQAGVMGKLMETKNTRFGRDAIFTSLYKTPAAAFPIKYADGIYGGSNLYQNPVYLLKDYGHTRDMYGTLLADLSLRQSLDALTEGLGAELSVAFDNVGSMTESSSKTLRSEIMNASITEDGTLVTRPEITGTDSPVLNHSQGFKSLSMRNDFQAKVYYRRKFDAHSIDAAVIYEMQSDIRNGRNNTRKNQSILAMATYNYADRYTLTAVFNRSGSAYLPDGHKFANYPAVSAAWILSNESFLKCSKTVDDLRLRASYGLSGWDGNLSHELWRYSYGATNTNYLFGNSTGGTTAGAGEGTLPVKGLVAERAEKATVGLDFAAFRNRLHATIEGFYERRSDILVSGSNSTSGIIGIGVGQVNEGINRFCGFDFSVDWHHQVGDFAYGIGASGSYLDSKIIADGQAFQEYDYLYTAGNRVGQCYGLEAIGFFNNEQEIHNSPTQTFSQVRPGDVKYKDQNGDNRIDAKDVVRMFDTQKPRFYYGFHLDFSYRGFELSAAFQGMSGVTVNLLNSPLYKPLSENSTISDTFLAREVCWTPDTKTTATMPRLTTEANQNNYRASSLWYRDGSFLKLRNLTIAYTFPKAMTHFADFKVFVTATNLFSIDNIDFADPEQLAAGYPATRSFWAGVKLNF